MQKIKGGLSYRAKREQSFRGEIWQRGFSDNRVWNAEEFLAVKNYIHESPVRKGMVSLAEDYPFSSAHPKFKAAGAKAQEN
jgi:putative transposase